MKCPGSGQMARRSSKGQKGLIVCGSCPAWFRPYGLIYDTPRGNVALGVIPPHQVIIR